VEAYQHYESKIAISKIDRKRLAKEKGWSVSDKENRHWQLNISWN